MRDWELQLIMLNILSAFYKKCEFKNLLLCKVILNALLQIPFFFKTDATVFTRFLLFMLLYSFCIFPRLLRFYSLFPVGKYLESIKGCVLCWWETFFPKLKVTSHLPPTRDYNILIKPNSNKLDPPKSNFFEEVFYLSTILGGCFHTALLQFSNEGQKIRGVIGWGTVGCLSWGVFEFIATYP